ncbi:hypothetical protein BE08_34475 [Sorangium cellulosum]|uniref:Uncharacterized protein n=1 Tax=Sorangium cellulosum TaxID=56 RepID=A0A150PNA3_SORCE|nr:hypothetical protein BE08_34475 [Sorangium cellulosum]
MPSGPPASGRGVRLLALDTAWGARRSGASIGGPPKTSISPKPCGYGSPASRRRSSSRSGPSSRSASSDPNPIRPPGRDGTPGSSHSSPSCALSRPKPPCLPEKALPGGGSQGIVLRAGGGGYPSAGTSGGRGRWAVISELE